MSSFFLVDEEHYRILLEASSTHHSADHSEACREADVCQQSITLQLERSTKTAYTHEQTHTQHKYDVCPYYNASPTRPWQRHAMRTGSHYSNSKCPEGYKKSSPSIDEEIGLRGK